MPIKPRGHADIYTRLRQTIKNAQKFIIFGTYSINTDYSIVRSIVDRKRGSPNLFVCAFIPPPTDFIIWDPTIRRSFANAYGFPPNVQEELNEAIALNPVPAFQVLEQIWQQARSRRRYYQVVRHIIQIFDLWNNNIHVLLEPNTHAKFIMTDREIYEGSANLTRYGIEVNVEVYNFYPKKYPRIYEYAFRTYRTFLIDYINKFVRWKDASNYVNNANLLGQTIFDVINNLQLKFNPSVSMEKINKIRTARIYLNKIRSDMWMLPGIKEIFKNDMVLSIIDKNLSGIIGILYDILNKEKEYADKNTKEILNKINKKLEINVEGIKQFKEHFPWKDLKIDDDEMMQNNKSIKEFKSFIKELESYTNEKG